MIATAGVLVLLLLYLDVFLTVFHPEGHGGLLTGRLNRATWGGFRALSGARPAKALAFAAAIIAGYFRRGERETLELVRSSGFEPLARWSEDVTARLLQVQRAHFQYPIVHYFRPTDQMFALPVQLAHLLAIRRRAGGVGGAPAVRELSRHPSVQALASAVETYLRKVETHFVPAAFEPGRSPMPTRPSARSGACCGTCATRRMSSAGWRAPALGGSSTRRGRMGTALIVGVALVAAAPAAAQGPSASPVPSGTGYGMGLVLTRPLLDARARGPFEEVGRFRAGPGMALWLRFDRGALGASATAEAAGLDVGPEIVRDGISMGRQAAVYAAFAALVHWRPARARAVGWRPEVFAGPVLTSLGEVAVRTDQLPPYARDSAAEAEDTTALSTGIRGRGVRLGVALERTWAGSGLWDNVSVRAELAADRIGIGEMEHGGRRVRLPRYGTATFPRLVVGLTWRPSPGRAPGRDTVPGAAARPAPRDRRGRSGAPGSQEGSGRSVRPPPDVPYD